MIYIGRLSKIDARLKAIDDYRRKEAIKILFNKENDSLTEEESITLEQYIHDKDFPVWKPAIINGYKTRYVVNKFGDVYNPISNKYLSTHYDKDGYKMCSITISGEKKMTVGIHRIVGFTFIPNDDPEHKTQINHKNTNKECNWVGNLEWCTPKENVYHAYRLGLEKSLFKPGESNSKNIYSEEKIREICKLLEDSSLPPNEIAKITGVNNSIVDSVRSRKTWVNISKDYTISETKFNVGETHLKAKYKESQIHEICKLLEKGIAPGKIANKLGVHPMLVQSVRKGKSWAHISKDYKFPKIDYTHGEQKVQAKYSNEMIRKVCSLLMDPTITYIDISKETGVHKDTIFRIYKGTQWIEIAKDYKFPKRGKVAENGMADQPSHDKS